MDKTPWQINKPAFVREIKKRLQAGQVVMMPSDTVYGLFALANSKKAIERIYAIKKRAKSQPLLVVVSSFSMAKRYCEINSKQFLRLRQLWLAARPTTVILKHRNLLPRSLTAGKEGLAMRLPKSDFLRKMIRSLGVPLISTSANLSGEAVLDGETALRVFTQSPRPDLLVTQGKNRSLASRLVSLDEDGVVTILRK